MGRLAVRPRLDDVAQANAHQHEDQVHRELPSGVAGKLKTQGILEVLLALLDGSKVLRREPVGEHGQDVGAHGRRRQGEEKRHDKAAKGPFVAFHLHGTPLDRRKVPLSQDPAPPVKVALHLRGRAVEGRGQATGAMGARRGHHQQNLLAQALEAWVHGRVALTQKAQQRVVLSRDHGETDAGAAPGVHGGAQPLAGHRVPQHPHVRPYRALGAAQVIRELHGREMALRIQEPAKKLPLSRVHERPGAERSSVSVTGQWSEPMTWVRQSAATTLSLRASDTRK